MNRDFRGFDIDPRRPEPLIRGWSPRSAAVVLLVLLLGIAGAATAQSDGAPADPRWYPGYVGGAASTLERVAAPSVSGGPASWVSLVLIGMRRVEGTEWERIAAGLEWRGGPGHGSTMRVGGVLIHSDLANDVELGSTGVVPAGRYTSGMVRVRYSGRQSGVLVPDVQITTGAYLTGWISDLAIAPARYRSRLLDAGIGVRYFDVHLPSGGGMSGTVVRVRAGVRPATALTLDLVAQYATPTGRLLRGAGVTAIARGDHELRISYDEGLIWESGYAPPRQGRTARAIRISYVRSA